jgi:hypothetical protein
MTDTPTIRVEVAPGELIDKITILEIKAERMRDQQRRQNVQRELDCLASARQAAIPGSSSLDELTRQLKEVNEALWEIEDNIRRCEQRKDFGPEFIELARSVYHSNDRRADLKRQINRLLGSRLIEEKEYVRYDA